MPKAKAYVFVGILIVWGGALVISAFAICSFIDEARWASLLFPFWVLGAAFFILFAYWMKKSGNLDKMEKLL